MNPALLTKLTASLSSLSPEESNDEELLGLAKQTIKERRIDDEAHCFLLFAAFNYLNAAVKRDKSVGYYFKAVFKEVVPLIEDNDFDIDFYLDSDAKGSILYVEFEGCFQFSFHNPNIKAIASKRIIAFDGIRKQGVAGFILKQARLFIRAGDLPEV